MEFGTRKGDRDYFDVSTFASPRSRLFQEPGGELQPSALWSVTTRCVTLVSLRLAERTPILTSTIKGNLEINGICTSA